MTLSAAAAALLVAAGGGYFAGASAHASGAVNARPPAVAPTPPGSFADLVAKVAPAVVSIDVVEKPTPAGGVQGFPMQFGSPGPQGQQQGPMQFFQFMFPQGVPNPQPMRGAGSGFFVSPDGYLVTNNHVIADARTITVHTNDGRALSASVVGRDPATDLAVLKVAGGPYPYVSFEDRGQPRVGDWVVAVGNPFGLGGTATAGIVSALNRENVSGSSFVDYMQIDAPINRGNSGGPTFDVYGRVVGVNSAIFSPSGGSVGIGFDIPASVAARVTKQLISYGKVTRGYIGAEIQDLTPELAGGMGLGATHGALVAQLTPGGPAQQAGLQSGDVIVSVDDRPVDSASTLTQAVGAARPGEELRLTVLRSGRRREVTIRSGLRPSEQALASSLGQSASPFTPGSAGGGVLGMQLAPDSSGGLVIEQVAPSSDAAAQGLRAGDVILRAGASKVSSPEDIARAVAGARRADRKSVPLLVARGGQRIYVPVGIAGAKG
ncbi:MAG TPA: Do family serine endopeptidase [Caulobacteraceae bacterium]|nr:Do family serine endopeptidase [Caulobacteraceae bacterium]